MLLERELPSAEDLKHIKEKVHSAAKDGIAIEINNLLYDFKKAHISEILDHVTEDGDQKTTPLVAAAMAGHVSVVTTLIDNFGVNMEQKSTVRFDGYIIEEATALWCASGAGFLDAVMVLVKNGADVNNSTASRSTPLRAACFDGRLSIVKYLLENGADISIPNKYGNTCLMISSFKGHAKVVRLLLEWGANPDIKAHCNATSIHFAVDCGHIDVVKELVHFNASMITNSDGMTPIMIAAESGREDVVSFLLENTDCSSIQQIQAMELLGASFANDKDLYNLSKSFHYLKKAMVLKTDNQVKQWLNPMSISYPIKAYNYHRESQNMEELETLGDDANGLHMEALTIRERILGSSNPEIPHAVIYRGAVFADSGRFDRCISLWMHALVLRQTHSRSISKDLLRLAQVFSQMVSTKEDLCFEDIEAVIEHGIKEIELYHMQNSKNVSDTSNESGTKEQYDSNILSLIYLITICLHLDKSDTETHRFRRLVYTFLKSKIQYKGGSSPLHIVVDPTVPINDFHVNAIVSFPNKALVSLFLFLGADINALDDNRNSALHIVTQCHMPNITKERMRHEILLHLLRNGAHCDIANIDRKSPFTFARGTTLSLLCSHSDLTLKCFSARCIRENKITYSDFDIPQCLKDFINWH